jgi:hypothetical protein
MLRVRERLTACEKKHRVALTTWQAETEQEISRQHIGRTRDSTHILASRDSMRGPLTVKKEQTSTHILVRRDRVRERSANSI